MRMHSLALALVLVACQSETSLGVECMRGADCAEPLVCRLGRCRTACTLNRDCPAGSQCFLDATGLGACALDVDRSCGTTACATGLDCLGGECVHACGGASHCPADGHCETASGASVGVCVDDRSATDAGPSADAGAADAGSGCATLAVDQVCAGRDFTCALRTDHTVVCWGIDVYAQLGSDTTETCPADPTPVPCSRTPLTVPLVEGGAMNDVEEIDCGAELACARRMDGTVRCWGRNWTGQLGSPGEGPGARTVVDVRGVPMTGATAIRVSEVHACALLGTNGVWCWGESADARLGRGAGSSSVDPDHATELEALGMLQGITLYGEGTCAITASSGLACLGLDQYGQLARDPVATPTSPTPLAIPVTLSASSPIVRGGGGGICAIDDAGHVACWGVDNAGFTGRSMFAYARSDVAGLYGSASAVTFVDLFAGSLRGTNCAITAAGGVWCWGEDANGQAAHDPTQPWTPAVEITTLHAIRSGACSDTHCCAVDATHQLWCWGANTFAELGRGEPTTSFDLTPAIVCPP
jgi:alpha-tubulin suppressor-like RCC1 family protein